MERTVQKCVKLAQFVLLLKLAKLLKLVRSIVETSEQLNLEDKVTLLANFIEIVIFSAKVMISASKYTD